MGGGITARTTIELGKDFTREITGTDIGTLKRGLDIKVVADGFLDLIEPTVSATACVDGDFVQEFEVPNIHTRDGGSSILQQIALINTGDTTGPDVALWLFGKVLSVGQSTGDALVLTDSELESFIFKVPVFGGSFRGAGSTNGAGQIGQQNILIKNLENAKGMYVVVEALTGFTPPADGYKWRFGALPL